MFRSTVQKKKPGAAFKPKIKKRPTVVNAPPALADDAISTAPGSIVSIGPVSSTNMVMEPTVSSATEPTISTAIESAISTDIEPVSSKDIETAISTSMEPSFSTAMERALSSETLELAVSSDVVEPSLEVGSNAAVEKHHLIQPAGLSIFTQPSTESQSGDDTCIKSTTLSSLISSRFSQGTLSNSEVQRRQARKLAMKEKRRPRNVDNDQDLTNLEKEEVDSVEIPKTGLSSVTNLPRFL